MQVKYTPSNPSNYESVNTVSYEMLGSILIGIAVFIVFIVFIVL